MRRGKPSLADSDDDRCVALTMMTEWKKAHKREERCPFKARWSVQGKQLCRHHMIVEVCAIAMEQGYIQRLYIPPSAVGQRVRVAEKGG